MRSTFFVNWRIISRHGWQHSVLLLDGRGVRKMKSLLLLLATDTDDGLLSTIISYCSRISSSFCCWRRFSNIGTMVFLWYRKAMFSKSSTRSRNGLHVPLPKGVIADRVWIALKIRSNIWNKNPYLPWKSMIQPNIKNKLVQHKNFVQHKINRPTSPG